MELSERIRIESNDDDIYEEIEETLDDKGIDYDWDMAGRLMITSDDLDVVEDILSEKHIEYSVI